ncbi:MAG TPA: mechanosensitive ion channel domain-containing protein [Pyrinomonadaceae bacterium]
MFLQSPTPAPSPQPPTTLTEVFAELQNSLLRALPGMFRGVLVFLIFWLVASVGRRIIALAAPRVRADTGVVLLLSRIYYYGILIFGTVTALGAAGLNVSALVTGLGLTGFALGFALKDVLSNLLSGIMLLLYRPFNIGDEIRMGEYEGRIETIRMRDTLVRAHDGQLIVIPNTKLITEVVVNYTQARQQGAESDGRAAAAAIRPAAAAAASPAESEDYWQPPQQ